MELFEVGGCVRDEILGLKSKDIDFSVVLNDADKRLCTEDNIPPFELMELTLLGRGFEIFVRNPEFLTIRARFPRLGPESYNNLTADFVLARKEAGYSDGRRPDEVIPGTLEDDLARRDFTMNAIAKDAQGNLIDPFGGQEDIERRVIRAVGDARTRIVEEDALRGLRALRFAVQKGFAIDEEVKDVLRSKAFQLALLSVSTERVKDELEKMFKVDTIRTLDLIQEFSLELVLFDNTGLRLMPTMKG